MRATAALSLVVLCVLAAGIGFFAYRELSPVPAPQAPALHFTDLDGKPRQLSEWRGRPLLINFWATWCAPCLQEIPMLIKAQTELADTGLMILGPAVDEAEPVRHFHAERDLNYPVFVGADQAIMAMDALGDTRGALPWSVFIAPDGRIVARHSGILSREQLESWLERYR